MRLAVLSESPADEAAIRILIDGLLGETTTPIDLGKFRGRYGWQTRLNILDAVYKDLYYQTDADALVFVLDSDRSPIHEPSHEEPGGSNPKCRLCLARDKLVKIQGSLKPVSTRATLRCAVGLAVPCIEAWFRCGKGRGVSEAAWVQGALKQRFPYDAAKLKKDVYGTDRPGLQLETARMVEEASRLVGEFADLVQMFPIGFGALAGAVQSWK